MRDPRGCASTNREWGIRVRGGNCGWWRCRISVYAKGNVEKKWWIWLRDENRGVYWRRLRSSGLAADEMAALSGGKRVWHQPSAIFRSFCNNSANHRRVCMYVWRGCCSGNRFWRSPRYKREKLPSRGHRTSTARPRVGPRLLRSPSDKWYFIVNMEQLAQFVSKSFDHANPAANHSQHQNRETIVTSAPVDRTNKPHLHHLNRHHHHLHQHHHFQQSSVEKSPSEHPLVITKPGAASSANSSVSSTNNNNNNSVTTSTTAAITLSVAHLLGSSSSADSVSESRTPCFSLFSITSRNVMNAFQPVCRNLRIQAFKYTLEPFSGP